MRNIAQYPVRQNAPVDVTNTEDSDCGESRKAPDALNGIHRRFGVEIETFARAQLEGKRTKTLKTAFGAVSFRVAQTSHRILDMATLVAWAKANVPAIVRTRHLEDVLVSDLAYWFDRYDGDLEPPPGTIETRPGGERMTIKTGIPKSTAEAESDGAHHDKD